jgi:hypothetical protein
MDCDDAEEARDLLRHKNSNVTRAIYRAHFGDRRRELLRARMECHERGRAEGGPPRRLRRVCFSTREGEALSWSISGSIGRIAGRRGVRSVTPA